MDGSAGRGAEREVSRNEGERAGRWHAALRCGLVVGALLACRYPLGQVATNAWTSVTPLPADVPARLYLLLDLALVLAYLTGSSRLCDVVRVSGAPPLWQSAATVARTLVVLGALLDVVEDALLWSGDPGPGRLGASVPHVSDALVSGVRATLVAAGVVGLLVVAATSDPGFWWTDEGGTVQPRAVWRAWPRLAERLQEPEQAAPELAWWRAALRATPAATGPEPATGTILCCSGGGVRSASFCLGGLQVLTEEGVYGAARAVVGVSGGGYVAAAYHVLRRESPEALLAAVPAFAPASPEVRRLRGRTRYLAQSWVVATQGVLSLLFGLLVNLTMIGLAIGAFAWASAWFLAASGGLSGWSTTTAVVAYAGDWTWADRIWAVAAAGVALFAAERVVDRAVTLPGRARDVVRAVSVGAVWLGALLCVLLLLLPHTLVWLHQETLHRGDAYGALLYSLGLAPKIACLQRLAEDQPACGVTTAIGSTSVAAFTGTSVAAVVAAVLSVARLAGSGKDSASATSFAGRQLRRLGQLLRGVVLPWAASLLIAAVLALLALRWTALLVADPYRLDDWGTVRWGIGTLVVLRIATDANRTSLHAFYRERLTSAFLLRRTAPDRVGRLDRTTPLRFSRSGPIDGGPDLVMNAVANVSDVSFIPADRHCSPFVFDAEGIGLTDQRLPGGLGRVRAAVYERAAESQCRDATIPAAVGMSGAAFSPLAGRYNRKLGPYRFVMTVGNARLGVWLTNPLWVDEVRVLVRMVRSGVPEAAALCDGLPRAGRRRLLRSLSRAQVAWLRSRLVRVLGAELDGPDRLSCWDEDIAAATPRMRPQRSGPDLGGEQPGRPPRAHLHRAVWLFQDLMDKPGPFRLVKEAVGSPSVLDRKLYITDGGHYDNLGLVEALRRRPERVVVLDASSDAEGTFEAFGVAAATARMDLDAEVQLDPRGMRRVGEGRARAAFGSGTVTYSDGATAELHLVKVVLVDGLPWDVEAYAGGHPDFPRTSTGNQLYGELDMEAYRVLGREATRGLVRSWRSTSGTRPVGIPVQAG